MSVGFVCFSQNLVFYKGGAFDDTYTWAIDGTPVDLTGVSARMQVRTTADAPDPAPVDISTTNGKIVLGGAAGTLRLIIAAATTATLAEGAAVYDLELTWPDGSVQKFMRGSVIVFPEVTR